MITNWKTSFAGLLAGGGFVILSAMSQGVHLKDALLAGGLAAIGLFAKDHDVTGGSRDQSTP